MIKYVDAEWLKAFFEADKGKSRNTPIDSLLALIGEAPSIDICFCRECKYWSGCKSTMHNNHLCRRAENVDYWTRADDFCSYGEREGE